MFFNNCIDKNQNKVHFEEGSSEPPPHFRKAMLQIFKGVTDGTPLYQFHGQIALFKGPNFAT